MPKSRILSFPRKSSHARMAGQIKKDLKGKSMKSTLNVSALGWDSDSAYYTVWTKDSATPKSHADSIRSQKNSQASTFESGSNVVSHRTLEDWKNNHMPIIF